MDNSHTNRTLQDKDIDMQSNKRKFQSVNTNSSNVNETETSNKYLNNNTMTENQLLAKKQKVLEATSSVLPVNNEMKNHNPQPLTTTVFTTGDTVLFKTYKCTVEVTGNILESSVPINDKDFHLQLTPAHVFKLTYQKEPSKYTWFFALCVKASKLNRFEWCEIQTSWLHPIYRHLYPNGINQYMDWAIICTLNNVMTGSLISEPIVPSYWYNNNLRKVVQTQQNLIDKKCGHDYLEDSESDNKSNGKSDNESDEDFDNNNETSRKLQTNNNHIISNHSKSSAVSPIGVTPEYTISSEVVFQSQTWTICVTGNLIRIHDSITTITDERFIAQLKPVHVFKLNRPDTSKESGLQWIFLLLVKFADADEAQWFKLNRSMEQSIFIPMYPHRSDAKRMDWKTICNNNNMIKGSRGPEPMISPCWYKDYQNKNVSRKKYDEKNKTKSFSD